MQTDGSALPMIYWIALTVVLVLLLLAALPEDRMG
jgi:hypothetical protein